MLTLLARALGKLTSLVLKLTLRDKIIVAQKDDPSYKRSSPKLESRKMKGFEISNDKSLKFKGQLCMYKDEGLIKEIMIETHFASYVTYLGNTKMYRDLCNTFWWKNMKGIITLFVLKCIVCQ